MSETLGFNCARFLAQFLFNQFWKQVRMSESKKKRQFMVLFSIPGPVFTTKLRKDIDHYPMQMQLSTFYQDVVGFPDSQLCQKMQKLPLRAPSLGVPSSNF